uniref:Putative secreted peptide n=1 Tax=Anopheles braziliensis TaxID=58242 RepID=A0A2M3ZUH0_9DIPT
MLTVKKVVSLSATVTAVCLSVAESARIASSTGVRCARRISWAQTICESTFGYTTMSDRIRARTAVTAFGRRAA